MKQNCLVIQTCEKSIILYVVGPLFRTNNQNKKLANFLSKLLIEAYCLKEALWGSTCGI